MFFYPFFYLLCNLFSWDSLDKAYLYGTKLPRLRVQFTPETHITLFLFTAVARRRCCVMLNNAFQPVRNLIFLVCMTNFS